jgi:uncharacterized cysteine cluster protein YcgN (CxxCxxCC family)
MRDGLGRRLLKRVALWNFTINIRVHRAWRRARKERPYVLAGDCRRCARCCEAPAIQVGRSVWHLAPLRRAFLWWQERVNGFVQTGALKVSRTFVFRCTHFDPQTRLCDSYDSRPGMCRDYPRLLLWQVDPELLPGCGYRAVAPNADRLLAALSAQPLTEEQHEKLRRGLRLE